MDPRLRRLAPTIYRAYAWAFVLSGVTGALLAHLEAPLLHDLTVLPEQREGMRSLLNQVRFLRGLEAGFGLVMLACSESFFLRTSARSEINRAILAALFAIPAARTVSLLLDGAPQPVWTGLLIVEWALFLWMRRATEPAAGQRTAQQLDT